LTSEPTAARLADDLVAGDEGILADAPVVGDEMEVAMADAAVGDSDVDFLRADLARVVLEGQQFGARCMGCQSLYLSHSLSCSFFGGWKMAGWQVDLPENRTRKGKACRRETLTQLV
jgi:hypothetical protein